MHVGSVIYVIIMEYFKTNIKKVQNNQAHLLSPDMKTEKMDSLPYPGWYCIDQNKNEYIFLAEILGEDSNPEQDEDNEVIKGMIPKDNLTHVFQSTCK